MSVNLDGKTAIVEPGAGGVVSDTIRQSLDQRIRQQEILSELGVVALQGGDMHALLTDTVRLVAEGLSSEFCKVLEFVSADNCFTVRAGVGWGPDVVGVAQVGADLASPAGFALKTGKPVISNHLGNEQRFRTPELFARYNISRAMNVILQGDGAPFGVLEVDSRSEGDFTESDIPFLQGAANILGMAIERERNQRLLKAALERHQFLLKEMNHRIKNSLSIVISMLRLQAKDSGPSTATEQLDAAAIRVHAVARAHERLYQTDDVEHLDIGRYIEQVCRDIDASVAHCEIHIEAQHEVMIATDRAIPIALMVNELITNAAKHAYEGQTGFDIRVGLVRSGDMIEVSVSDEGIGLPPDFDLAKTKGLGMRLLRAFLQQLDATITINSHARGTEFVVVIPLEAKP
ncbi:MAG: histidine kinase dimerization/phosphoacceptor domain -containing protein [Hyphomicrobium sp.]